MLLRSLTVVFALWLVPGVWAAVKKSDSEPRISSIHPFSAAAASTYQASIRGTNLAGANALYFLEDGIRGRLLRLETEPVKDASKSQGTPGVLQVEITIDANVSPGERMFRAVTAGGLTNEIPLRVAPHPVAMQSSEPLRSFPIVVTGRLAERGETDEIWIDVESGQTLTFELDSGYASFDPNVSVYEHTASWFDGNRMERVTFNDEPLFFPGLSTDARLVHTFRKSGSYCVRIGSYSGQGGPDYVYELKVVPGALPEPDLHPKQKNGVWQERLFTRKLSPEWARQLSSRGGLTPLEQNLETWRAATSDSTNLPVMRVPAMVEGRISQAAEAHRIKLRIDKPQDIAIEIETPEATMPRFNPVVLLLEPGGTEIATNVYTKLNNNGLYMMKMIQAKTAVSLQAPGEYTLEIRDITTDCAGPDFLYRVMVREQIPHVGNVEVKEERVNLLPGDTKPLNVTLDREENFAGVLALSIEGLPPGVSAIAGAPDPIEKPPLPNGGKLERYTPRTQNSALLLTASADARPSELPATLRLIARPMSGRTLGEPILVKELPLLILERKP